MTTAADDMLPQAIARLIELGQPYRPPSAGSSLPAEGCFVGPEDPVAAPAALTAEFGEDILRTLGLIDESPLGDLEVDRAFTSGGPLLVVTARGASAPCGLIGENRTAPRGRLPVALLLGDGFTQDALDQHDHVLVLTETIASAVAYRALGVPAAPIEPLDGMDPAQRQELFEVLRGGRIRQASANVPRRRLGVRSKTRRATKLSDDYYPKGRSLAGQAGKAKQEKLAQRRRKPPSLVVRLAGWAPPDAPPIDEARLKRDAAWCAAAERYTSLELGDLAVWRPAPADLDQLTWAVQHGSSAYVRDALTASWAASSYEVSRFARADFRPSDTPANLIEAQQDLVNAIEGDHGDGPIEAAHRAVRCQAQRQLVEPLYALALQTEDPLERTCYALAAQEASIGQSLTGALQLALMRRNANSQHAISAQEAALLREHGKSVDRSLRLLKSLS